MRNLKRVLSLALALVMVLGMMVISTSAATFADDEEITLTEAVDVMSAIGVITGDNGNFYPNRVLTREEGAAFICYMLMGKDKADKLVGSGNFTDVKADRWSAGEIDYCANLGIVKGVGNDQFNPKGELTAVQFGGMLLGALGYDGSIEGYTGANWASSIAADMIEVGLDVKGVDMDAQLTREQAAQMAFQALTKTVVKYDDKGSSIIIGGVEISTGASDAEAVAETGYANYDLTGATANLQFCEKYFPNLKKAAGTNDAYGRPAAYKWFIDVDENDLWTANKDTVVANIMKTPAYTYDVTGRQDTTLAQIAEKLELDINGASITGTIYKGDTVELYLNNAGEIATAVKLHTELGKIAKVTKTTEEDAKYTYTVAVSTETGIVNYKDTALTGFDFDTMVKDTYVTLIKGTEAGTVALADSITGKQTAKGTGYTKIDGVQKYYAGDTWTTDSNEVNYTDTFNFYLDAKGLIIGTEKAAAGKVDTKIFYVDAYNFRLGNTFTPDAAKISVINLDGSKEILDMAITVTAGTKYVNKTTPLADDLTYTAGFYAYSLTEDGKVATLKAVGDTGVASTGVKDTKELASTEYVDFDAKEAKVAIDGGSKYATTETTLVVIDPDEQTAVTVTGYDSFTNTKYIVGTGTDTTTDKYVTGVLYTYSGSTLNTVYVLGTTLSVSDAGVTGWLVETGDEYEEKGVTYQDVVYNVKGEEITYKVVKAGSYLDYAKIVITDGVAGLSAPANTTYNEDVEKVTATYVVIDGVAVYFADGVAYYDVTDVKKNGVVADDAVVVGDIITYTTNRDGEITAVYTTYAAQENGQIFIDVTDEAGLAYFEDVLTQDADYLRGRPNGSAYAIIQHTWPADRENSAIILNAWYEDGTFDVENLNLYNGVDGNGAYSYANGLRGVVMIENADKIGETLYYSITVDGIITETGTFEYVKVVNPS